MKFGINHSSWLDDGWAVLAGLAAVTRRIRLATLATVVGYRNPAHLAKIAASVDLISQGRLTLGIGAARNEAAVATKRERLAARGPLRSFVGTVSEAIDLIGQYQDARVDLLINADRRNDVETRELFVSDLIPHFA